MLPVHTTRTLAIRIRGESSIGPPGPRGTGTACRMAPPRPWSAFVGLRARLDDVVGVGRAGVEPRSAVGDVVPAHAVLDVQRVVPPDPPDDVARGVARERVRKR